MTAFHQKKILNFDAFENNHLKKIGIMSVLLFISSCDASFILRFYYEIGIQTGGAADGKSCCYDVMIHMIQTKPLK